MFLLLTVPVGFVHAAMRFNFENCYKSGKSYRLEYSATFSYSDGRSETITGTEIPGQHLRELNIGRGTKKLITMEIRWIGQIIKFIIYSP